MDRDWKPNRACSPVLWTRHLIAAGALLAGFACGAGAQAARTIPFQGVERRIPKGIVH